MRPPALPTILLTLVSLAMPVPSIATIFKCVAVDGAVTYTGRPCPREDITAVVVEVRRGGSTTGRHARAPVPGTLGPGRYAEDDDETEARRPGAPAAAEPPPEREPPSRSAPR